MTTEIQYLAPQEVSIETAKASVISELESIFHIKKSNKGNEGLS